MSPLVDSPVEVKARTEGSSKLAARTYLWFESPEEPQELVHKKQEFPPLREDSLLRQGGLLLDGLLWLPLPEG